MVRDPEVKTMANNDENITILNYDTFELLKELQNAVNMDSLPNVLPFLALVVKKNSGLCFAGPARCGKTTMIHNVRFMLTARELIGSLGDEKWLSILAGEMTLLVEHPRDEEKLVLKYAPLKDSKDKFKKLAMSSNEGVVFHYRFENCHKLADMKNIIVEESLRVARIVSKNENVVMTNKNWKSLGNQMDEKFASSVRHIFLEFPTLERRNVFIFVDDYDIPFCDEEMGVDEFNQIKQKFIFFFNTCTQWSHICLFGSLSFPARILKVDKDSIFTMENSPIRILGIPQSAAKSYLEKLKRNDVDIRNSAGMLSNISHDIHPLCFRESLVRQLALIEIGSELKSYYCILQSLLRSPHTYKLLTTLYSNGWYTFLGEEYSDADIVNRYLKGSLSITGCVKILCSLGFIKKFEKVRNEDCLLQLNKSRQSLPGTYYSFTNIILYYSFTYFVKKLSNENNLLTSQPFHSMNWDLIIKLCHEFLDVNTSLSLRENDFVDKIFCQLIHIFPTYLVVIRFIVDDVKQYSLDLGLFSFYEDLPTYVWEFKIADSMYTIMEKEHEAIHQIYCRGYYNFIRCIDSTMSEASFKQRLKKMFFITYVTDTKEFCYTVIRKYNEKLACNCLQAEKFCFSSKTYYPIKAVYHQLPSNAGYSRLDPILPDSKRKRDLQEEEEEEDDENAS